MEDKRTIIAIVLSIVVLIGWTHLAEYMGWVQPRDGFLYGRSREISLFSC